MGKKSLLWFWKGPPSDSHHILCLLKDGNDFEEPYQEMEFFMPQLIMIKLEVSEPIIVFNPSFDDCWELIHNSFLEIIKNSREIPKV